MNIQYYEFVVVVALVTALTPQLSEVQNIPSFLDGGHPIACCKNPINMTRYFPTMEPSLLGRYRCDCYNKFIRCKTLSPKRRCSNRAKPSHRGNSTSPSPNHDYQDMAANSNKTVFSFGQTKFHLSDSVSGQNQSNTQSLEHLKNASLALGISLSDLSSKRERLLNKISERKQNRNCSRSLTSTNRNQIQRAI